MSGTRGQRKRQSHKSAHGGKPGFIVQFLRFQSEEDHIFATSRQNLGHFHAVRDANHNLLPGSSAHVLLRFLLSSVFLLSQFCQMVHFWNTGAKV